MAERLGGHKVLRVFEIFIMSLIIFVLGFVYDFTADPIQRPLVNTELDFLDRCPLAVRFLWVSFF